MRTTLLCWLLAASVIGTIGCAPRSGAPTDPSSEKQLIYGRGADATTLDPADAEDGESVKAIVNLYDNLVGYADGSADLAPSLATQWHESDDRRTWTFTLREGVTFHDGTPFDANAVVFTFERMLKPDHPHRHGAKAPYRTDFAIIESVAATSPHEVVFKLQRPSGVFLRNLAMFAACIVSPEAVQKHGDKFKVNPVGTGPFRFEEWALNEKLVLVANADHWRGPPKLDRVIFKPILEDAARLRQLQTGEIDMADELSIPTRQRIREDANLKLLSSPGMNVSYFSMNNSRPPFDNPLVRKAVAHAINKEEILANVYENAGRIATTIVPAALWGSATDIKDHAYDPELAKKLLQEAGIKPGHKIQFWAMTNPRPYMPSPSRVAAVIQQQLRQVGLDLVIHSPPWSQYLDQVGNGEHEACLLGWQTDNADPDNFLYALLDKDHAVPPNALNVSFYKSDQVHVTLIDAQQESNQERRSELYHTAQELIHYEVPLIPLMNLDLAVAMRSNIQGYRLHPTGNVYLRNVDVE